MAGRGRPLGKSKDYSRVADDLQRDSRNEEMTVTASETLFQQLCVDNGVPCEPISTGQEPTPDFKLFLSHSLAATAVSRLTRIRQ